MRPTYKAKPIGSISGLATALGTTEAVLLDFAKNIGSHYSHFQRPKKNSDKLRDICSPNHELKIIQKRINNRIFENVEYPDYLYGGIQGRDYVKNAQYHQGARALLAFDVKDFYPSITRKLVVEIFKFFCKFPDDVSNLLADLTTLNGIVPQGACTSSHIANLVFHDVEHRLVGELKEKKLRYSRLLDDISISATRKLNQKEINFIESKVLALLAIKKFKIKKEKTRITSIENPEKLMEVTGLWLNRFRPRVKPAERESIRNELFRCEKNFTLSRTDSSYHTDYNSISGRVAKLSHVGHSEAEDYRERLRKILPHYNLSAIKKTNNLVDMLAKSRKSDRGKHSYIETYHKVMYRINILSRSHPSFARELRIKMGKCFPTQTKKSVIYGNPI